MDDYSLEKGTETDRSAETEKAGVFVYSTRDPLGNPVVDYEVLGDVDPLAISNMLEHASRLARRRIGLPLDR